MAVKTVGILTAGGLAPCLSSAVGALIERYSEIAPEVQIRLYRDGYKGLLLGDSHLVTPELREQAHRLHRFGGSPLGNSRVKLSNVKDCVRRGLVPEGLDPRKAAADRLKADGIDVLHTIGGDDTNTAAADLAAFLAEGGYGLVVLGLPKTVDNDVIPVRQSLGASTAAEQGARFFANVVAEHSANPRMLIVHEVMGRHCGWLTAATARAWRSQLAALDDVPGLGVDRRRLDVHAVYVPEQHIDLAAEGRRLQAVMEELGNVNIFLSEGAGVEDIVAAMEARGESVPRDAFGHVKLDAVNPGAYFAKQFASAMGAEKVLVQKSGYFSRAAPANREDLRLIQACVDYAVDAALRGESGLVGHDEEQGNRLRAIEFTRVRGGKAFDASTPWFQDLLRDIGQA